jgi:cell wall-associated NlpC family hydrolase
MDGQRAVVAVPVACGWRDPDSPRAMDAPALAAAPDLPAWIAGMDDDAKRDLVGRLETQLLLGEPVNVLATVGDWARISVPDQPASADGTPYECWVQLAQIATEARFATPVDRVATVVVPMATLERDGAALQVSFGTSLPVTAEDGSRIHVAVRDSGSGSGAGSGSLPRSAVAVHAAGAAALRATPASVIACARAFVGLPYLWAGRSAFGFDCSGLVQLVHRVHGVILPRDTGPMSEAGTLVDPDQRAPGDLVFFERDGDVHHVVTWIGDGLVVESPKTGLAARVIALEALPYANEVVLTRRNLHA